ncbi:collagen alpha-1(III) chain-like [Vombatus ursinus]|uniref:collagen alpha-1(III) chain-like n=1 Tax=Vombatus ursinus TaxID=29139 RepID=UPI000FFDAFFD|nr:collagen alpha-1(III) chain-like [Vombatus ursinus]XP_027732887.1 collagen alpha-1(III) chain-like [Vombatus ursinus]
MPQRGPAPQPRQRGREGGVRGVREVPPPGTGHGQGAGSGPPLSMPQFPHLENEGVEPGGGLSVVAFNHKPGSQRGSPGTRSPPPPHAPPHSQRRPTTYPSARSWGEGGVASYPSTGSGGNSGQEGPKDPGNDRGAVPVKEESPSGRWSEAFALSTPPLPRRPSPASGTSAPGPARAFGGGGGGERRGRGGGKDSWCELQRAGLSRPHPLIGDAARRHEVGLPLYSPLPPAGARFPGLAPGPAPSPLYKRASGQPGVPRRASARASAVCFNANGSDEGVGARSEVGDGRGLLVMPGREQKPLSAGVFHLESVSELGWKKNMNS